MFNSTYYDGFKADELFCRIAGMFYTRFEKEKIMDRRMIENCIENIDNAPVLTGTEQALISKSVALIDKLSTAKRIAGTVNDPVEKFFYRSGDGSAGWGMSVAKIDIAGETKRRHTTTTPIV